jgi:hypothetical protein
VSLAIKLSLYMFWPMMAIIRRPTQKMHRQIQNTLKLYNNIINQQKRRYILQMNPKAPTLKANIKIHKPSRPIRPVINNTYAPSYKLAKPIHYKRKNLIILKHELNIINSTVC